MDGDVYELFGGFAVRNWAMCEVKL